MVTTARVDNETKFTFVLENVETTRLSMPKTLEELNTGDYSKLQEAYNQLEERPHIAILNWFERLQRPGNPVAARTLKR